MGRFGPKVPNSDYYPDIPVMTPEDRRDGIASLAKVKLSIDNTIKLWLKIDKCWGIICEDCPLNAYLIHNRTYCDMMIELTKEDKS